MDGAQREESPIVRQEGVVQEVRKGKERARKWVDKGQRKWNSCVLSCALKDKGGKGS